MLKIRKNLMTLENNMKSLGITLVNGLHHFGKLLVYFVKWSFLASCSTLVIRTIDVYLLSDQLNFSIESFDKLIDSVIAVLRVIYDVKTVIVFSLSLGIYTIISTFMTHLEQVRPKPIKKFLSCPVEENTFRFEETGDYNFENMQLILSPNENNKKLKPGESLEFEVSYRKHSSLIKALFIKKYEVCYNPYEGIKDTSNIKSIVILLNITICILMLLMVIFYIVVGVSNWVFFLVGITIFISFIITALKEGVEH